MIYPSYGSADDSGLGQLGQLRHALANASQVLAAAGSGWHELARATVFMAPVDLGVLNTAWQEVYPDPLDRAPHKYVPAPLPAGVKVAVQILAVKGAPPRRVIELDSIRHGDWMTMAALTGNLVTSSRVIAPRSDDAAAYTAEVLENIQTIMERAGGSLRDLQQITAFIGETSYRDLVISEIKERLGDSGVLPKLHFIEAKLGGVKAPRMEIIGVVQPES
jgi:enamine deaminase RidA (YjgF/YER057c/UK114 family)